jgi:uncharacterized ubiquitin-like protein YukD
MLLLWDGDGYRSLPGHDECVYVCSDETMIRLVIENFDGINEIKSDGKRITRFRLFDKLYINISNIAQYCNDLKEIADLLGKLKEIFKLKRLEGGFGYLGMRLFLQKTKKKIFRLNRRVQEFIQEGFVGGRCECYYTGKHENISIYDINSAYPYAMIFSFPAGFSYVTSKFDEKRMGFWRVKFSGDHNYFFDMKTRMYVNQGEGILTSEEITFALENGFRVEILEGVVFSDVEYYFRDFIVKMYELRQNIQDQRIKKIIKLCINSLSMKFAQRETVYIVKKLDSLHDMTNCIQIADDLGLVSQYKRNIYSNIAISALITARTRLQLYQAMQRVNTIYCDTDSIHTQDVDVAKKISIGDDLGQWKVVGTGLTVSYKAKKVYYIHDYDELRAAGVRVRKRKRIDRTQVFICERLGSLEEIFTQRQVIKHRYTFVV